MEAYCAHKVTIALLRTMFPHSWRRLHPHFNTKRSYKIIAQRRLSGKAVSQPTAGARAVPSTRLSHKHLRRVCPFSAGMKDPAYRADEKG